MNLSGLASGLSATYPGYTKQRGVDLQNDKSQIELDQAQTGQEADKAWGNAIPVLQQMLMPGAQPMQPGSVTAAPQVQSQGFQQPPMPGQASQPRQPYPQPQTMAAPPPPNDPTWTARPPAPPMAQGQTFDGVGDRFGGLPGGNAPPQTPAPPMQQGAPSPQGQPQQSPQHGQLNLHTVMAAVIKANPGASPQVIAGAVAKAFPAMTAQSQMDYKQLMVQLGQKREEGRNDRHEQKLGSSEMIAGGQQETRRYVADQNSAVRREAEQGRNTRAELSNQTKLAVSTLSADARREIAELQDAGRTGRAQLSAETRKEIAKLNSATRLEILGIAEEGKDARFAAGEEGKNNRQYTTEKNRNARFSEGQTRQDERQTITEQGRGQRAELSSNTKLELGRLSRETQQELADFREGRRDARAELSAATKRELGMLSVEARKEIAAAAEQGRTTRQGVAEQGRNERFETGQAGQDNRAAAGRETREGIAARSEQGRNERFETAEARKTEYLSERIRLQDAALQRAVVKDKTLADNTQNRRTLKLMEDENNAEFRRAQLKIQASNTMQPAARKKLEADVQAAYDNAASRIQQYRSQMGGGGSPNTGGEQGPGTSGAPMKVKSPAEAAALKPGTLYVTPDGKQYTR